MHRLKLLVLVVVLLLLAVPLGLPDSGSPEPDGAEAATAEGIDKITGTIKGTYHLGFTDYVQTYDAVTTANLVWEADPDFFAEGCQCRPFFPTGTIDWSYRYNVVSESIDCDVTVGGQVAAGTGLFDKEEQMLVLWDDITDETQYIFSGAGAVNASEDIFCENEGTSTLNAIGFLALPGPDELNTTTPTFPALAVAQPAAPAAPLCEDAAPFKFPRDGQSIVGKCYDLFREDESVLEYVLYEWNLQIKPEPIIFIHGFLGSEINGCGEELWPNVGVFDRPQLLEMALAADGVSPALGACNATVGNIVRSVIIDIYGKTVDFLEDLAPGSAYVFPWDWRKAPQESLADLNRFIIEKRLAHNGAKVVLMAHSYGGLLARLYLDSAGNRENVARAVTIGTPAWGSPKALFPLYAGVEAPGGGGLNALLNKQNLHEFAKNLAGDYYLYPSASYGPWLTVGGYPYPPPLGQQGVLDYVNSLGGNTALLSNAFGTHASVLDTPYVGTASDPKFEIIVGTGLPTIVAVTILPNGHVKITYGNGDETVPAKSAARGALGPANPNKAHTYYSCRVGHVKLPGNSQITDAIDDFLKFGEDIEGLENPCPFSGFQIRVFRLPAVSSAAAGGGAGTGSAMSIEDAENQGLIDYLDFPEEKFVVAGGDIPEIALPEGAFLEVTPLSEDAPDGKGKPTVYGPLSGQATVSVGGGGASVLVNGEAPPLHGDVNCDEEVTPLDALLLILYAGGTPGASPGNCSDIGSGSLPFGDLDCSNSVTALDALAGLQIASGARLDFLDAC